VSKLKMMCPFSRKLCRECPVYLGRHYYLCFCREYRGHLEHSEGTSAGCSQPDNTAFRFEMPPLPFSSPTWLRFRDFPEREEA
jgi:hypothetical protein